MNREDPTGGTPEVSSEEQRVWLCNTDVEAEWACTENKELPQRGERTAIFHRFEEILLPSIGATDVAILRTAPDPHFLSYLESLGLGLPEVLIPRGAERAPWTSTTQLIQEDSFSIQELTSRVRSGRCSILEPFGVSTDVEKIADRTGLQLAGSGAETAALVSRKSTARRLARKLGFPLPDGEVCEKPGEIPEVVRRLRSAGNGCPVVIKPELGASGLGQRIVRTTADLECLEVAINRGELGGRGTMYVVERWYSALATLTFRFVMEKEGRVRGPFIAREAMGRAGPRHHGYFYPASFGGKAHDDLPSVVRRLAEALQREYSYIGPVRCDALVLHDDTLSYNHQIISSLVCLLISWLIQLAILCRQVWGNFQFLILLWRSGKLTLRRP